MTAVITGANSELHQPAVDLPTPRRIPALDGVRGLAILLVMFFHYTVLAPHNPIESTLCFVANKCWLGVDLFFVLSGFLITGILYDSKGSQSFFRTFYARRTLRIFPIYYAVLILYLIILPAVLSAAKLQEIAPIWGRHIWYWLYLSNFSISAHPVGGEGALNHCWSLAVEEQFYLIWPMVVFLFQRRTLIHICQGMFVLALAMRIGMVIEHAGWMRISFWTPCRCDSLAAGAWLALLARGPGGLAAHARAIKRIGIIAALMVVAIPIIQVMLHQKNGELHECIGYTFIALACAALLFMTMTPGPFLHIFSAGWLRFIGTISYGLYLYHYPIQVLVNAFYPASKFPRIHGSALPGQLLYYAINFVACMVVALLSWHLVEKHILKLKGLFRTQYKKPRALASVG